MRRVWFGFAALLAALATGSAQENTDLLPVFADHVEVNLVTLRVVVTTPFDQPVTDLTRDDFEVWEDGEQRELVDFERVVDGTIDELPADGAQSPVDQSSAARDLRRLVVLAFDSSNVGDLPFQRRAVSAAEDFVTAHAGSSVDWSIALVGGDPRCVLQPTSDTEAVVEGLRSLNRLFRGVIRGRSDLPVTFSRPSDAPLMDGPWCRMSMTEQALGMPQVTRALTDLFKAYAAIPGAKACVFFHPGGRSDAFAGCGGLRSGDMMTHLEAVDMWQRVARQAATAGFKVYAMSSKSLRPGMATADRAVSSALVKPSILGFSTNDAAAIMAARTGGDTFGSNDLGMVIDVAMRETGTYYSMAFTTPHPHDGKPHDIDVKVRGRGPLKVRHKKGVLDFDRRTILVEQLATRSEFSKRAGPLSVDLDLATHIIGDDRMEVEIVATIPYSSLMLVPLGEHLSGVLDVFLAVHDETGQLRGITEEQFQVSATDGLLETEKYGFPLRVLVPATENSITVAVYDPLSGLSGIETAIATPES